MRHHCGEGVIPAKLIKAALELLHQLISQGLLWRLADIRKQHGRHGNRQPVDVIGKHFGHDISWIRLKVRLDRVNKCYLPYEPKKDKLCNGQSLVARERKLTFLSSHKGHADMSFAQAWCTTGSHPQDGDTTSPSTFEVMFASFKHTQQAVL